MEKQHTDQKISISFDQGTLLVNGKQDSIFPIIKYIKFDPRIKLFRARAYHYAPIVLSLHQQGIPFDDQAKAFKPLNLELKTEMSPRHYQQDALNAWINASGRGLVIMPTGAGKSYFGILAIARIKRPTLVVVPTIDLMQQWTGQLEKAFNCKVGMLGGGSKEILELTVTTYDSAVLQMEFIGNRFGMVIFDECHHLPGPVNRLAASMCIAPYRLGLTATPDCGDDKADELLHSLVGPQVYTIEISDLKGKVLSPYRTKRIELELTADELDEYQRNRRIYTDFLKMNRIYFTSRSDWGRFIGLCARHPQGREVFEAYLEQKRIARSGKSKIEMVWKLINQHKGERMIIFTADNDTAYQLGKNFFLPVLTHRTKAAERKDFLEKFRAGDYPVMITSKVLNEGIDVPEASVGIVVSGSGSIREHVQRLGRILRPVENKQAILYELVSAGTSEVGVSTRRRKHRAYR